MARAKDTLQQLDDRGQVQANVAEWKHQLKWYSPDEMVGLLNAGSPNAIHP